MKDDDDDIGIDPLGCSIVAAAVTAACGFFVYAIVFAVRKGRGY